MSSSSGEDCNMMNMEKVSYDWNIPRVPVKKVYKKEWFKFNCDYSIKSVEETICLSSEHETIKLLSQQPFLSEQTFFGDYEGKYSYVHIGMVQIGVKPLTRQGLNSSVVIFLRDGRWIEFQDSLLGAIDSSLCKGPIYFNCFPNFTVSLSDERVEDVLTLDIKTSGLKKLPGSRPIALTYRIYYKLMANMRPKALVKSPPGQTILLQANIQTSNVEIVPKTIKWSDLKPPAQLSRKTTSNIKDGGSSSNHEPFGIFNISGPS